MKKRSLLLAIILMIAAACGSMDDEHEETAITKNQPAEVESEPGFFRSETVLEIDLLMADYSDGPGGAIMVIQDGRSSIKWLWFG